MDAVFLKILNMSLTASLLILAVLPIRLLMKKAPKWTSCLLWLIVAMALICPVRFESPVSVLPVADPIVITSDKPQTNDTLPLYQEEPILIQDIVEQDHSSIKPNYVKIGSTVWCIGMAALLGYAAFSWLRLKRRVAASIEIDNHIFVCDDIDTPFILGLFRPHIYLPSSLDETTAQQVLAHEQAHLARRDHWWKPLGYLLLTLHWFNPLVWMAYSLLCTDIELACDEKVIKNMDTISKKAYSEALLNCSIPRHLIAACPLAFGEVSVKQRISAVLHYKKPAFRVILIAIAVCVALCLGFLTEPIAEEDAETERAFAAFSHSSDDLRKITVCKDVDYEFVTANDIDRICSVLRELQFTEVSDTTPIPPKSQQIILETKGRDNIYLNFNEEYTTVQVITKDYTSEVYTVQNPETLQHPNFPRGVYWAEDEMHSVIEGFLQANKLNISNFEMLYQMVDAYGIYAVVSFDLLNSDGSIRAEHQLCLARLAAYNGEFYVIDVVSGQWSPTDGFYPNYTKFDDQAVLWGSGSGLDYDRFRIYYESGNGYYLPFRKDGFVYIMYEDNPTKLVPVDENNHEVVLLTFGSEYFTTTNQNNRIQINTQSGDILSITSYPVEQGSDITLPFAIYPDMDKSFQGHEALYDAIKTNSELNTEKWSELTLIGAKAYKDSEYAVIGYTQKPHGMCVLLEYKTNSDGTVSILNHDEGSSGESFGNFGYSMNHTNFGKSLYWTTFGDQRWATTKDGKETDNTNTVPTDYTGFRFIWADLQQEDYPADDSFFLAEVNTVIPPAITIPLAGSKALTALGWRLP